MIRHFAPALLAVMLAELSAPATAEERTSLDALVRAYPEQLAGYDSTDLIWRDGTRMPLSDGRPYKSFEEMLSHGSIIDQIRQRYPTGASVAPFDPLDDPGRVRNRAFFNKMYGNCWEGEVARRLVPVVWLPRSWGHTIWVTSVNGVAQRIAEISEELDALSPVIMRYGYPTAGTYACRDVADAGQPSMHAWGAAIDINAAHSDYWLWHRPNLLSAGAVNRIPAEIVDIFERHGFIWGGKWGHYDTMHFEYRPELLDDRAVTRQLAAAPRGR